jgi:hypothetical protein
VSESAKISVPHDEYTRRRETYRVIAERQARLYRMLANLRVVVVVLAGFLIWAASGGDWLAAYLAIFPIVLFVLLVLWQNERVNRVRRRAERAADFYGQGLARLSDQWIGTGQPGTRYLDENHPNALDLDLFGTGSLFELLCTARLRGGEDALASWLRAPAAADVLRARQAAVAELAPRLDLRERIALLAAEVPSGVDLQGLVDWGSAPQLGVSPWMRVAAVVLAGLALVSLTTWVTGRMGPAPFLVILLLEAGLALWLRPRVRQIVEPVERKAQDLALFAGILAYLESENFTTPPLRQLKTALQTQGVRPSQRIAELARLIDWLNARRNQLFAPIAIITLWTTRHAFAIEAWRAVAGPAIARWLAAVADFEALSSLSSYTYENQADPFPEIVPGEALIDGEGLGHPLIPASRCVRNDLRLGGDLRLLVVSGSNMSGKSTMLRTVGINVVMALAGAPVRAQRLRLSPLVVGATLRIQDSLQAGRSRFYAEITRVRQLVELANGSPPLLFLLDEFLQGTNSADRRVGAEAVVRTLVDHGAIGLITTHDLALAEIADLLAPRATNVHFEDHFENGTMTFDYCMRPGVVQKSNALALMRSVGIEV